jgi:hypothetical protein
MKKAAVVDPVGEMKIVEVENQALGKMTGQAVEEEKKAAGTPRGIQKAVESILRTAIVTTVEIVEAGAGVAVEVAIIVAVDPRQFIIVNRNRREVIFLIDSALNQGEENPDEVFRENGVKDLVYLLCDISYYV